MTQPRLLYVDDDPAGEDWLGEIFAGAGFAVQLCSSKAELERELEERYCRYHVALVDYRLDNRFGSPFSDGIEVTRALLARWPELEVIALSRHLEGRLGPSADRVVAKWVLAGARWFCRKQDFETQRGASRHLEVIKLCAERVERLRRRFTPRVDDLKVLAGLSRTMDVLERLAHLPAPVLLLGPTGVGKSFLARYIHEGSGREGDFVAVNCGAIPEALAESELFGHTKGAFTGATAAQPGKFGLADGGTLFLDEIGELSPTLQTKLLNALEDGEIWPVGGREAQPVDVRLIAATNRDLLGAIDAGDFREDLFFRVSVFPVRVPPLSERREDIRHLVEQFLGVFCEEFGRDVALAQDALAYLEARDYPGNVRELQNVLRRLVALSTSLLLTKEEVEEIDQLALSLPRGRSCREAIRSREQYVTEVVSWLRANIDRLGVSPDLKTPTAFVRSAIAVVAETRELVGEFPKGERYVLEKLIRPIDESLYQEIVSHRRDR